MSIESLKADVVIVGGGGAGLSAAAEAARLGTTVIVIEKARDVGGTTALSVGSFMAAGTRQQMRAGIDDSPETHSRDLDCGAPGDVAAVELEALLADVQRAGSRQRERAAGLAEGLADVAADSYLRRLSS